MHNQMVLTETPLICFRKQRVARNNRPMEQKSRGQQALVSPFQDFQKVHGKKEGKKTKKLFGNQQIGNSTLRFEM